MKKSAVEIIRKPGGALTLRRTIEIEVPEGTSLLEAEHSMQAVLMDAGAHLMESASSRVTTAHRPGWKDLHTSCRVRLA